MAADTSLTALLIEDDAALLEALGVILDRLGYQILQARSAAEALKATEKLRPDVVVLDVALSGEMGLGLLPVLVAAAPSSRIVVLSPFDALRGAALEAGAFALVGPLDLRHAERCLSLRGGVAQLGCDCCPPGLSAVDTEIAFDAESSKPGCTD